MELSLFLGKVLGIYFLVWAVAWIFRMKFFKEMYADFAKNIKAVNIVGWIEVLIGLFLLIGHNVWTASWPLIITIIALIILVKGACKVFFPKLAGKCLLAFNKNSWMIVGIVILLVLGVLLTVYSF